MNFSHLKVGDVVYVVPGKRGGEPFSTPVVRLGRRYGYIQKWSREVPFHLENGESVDRDGSSRINGHGFEIYPDEQAYLQEQFELGEWVRLSDRLVQAYRKEIIELPPEVVQKIHAVLDEWEKSETT